MVCAEFWPERRALLEARVGAVDSVTNPDLRDAPGLRAGSDRQDTTDRRDAADVRSGTVGRQLEQRLERLPPGHPSAPDFAASDRRGPADQARPLTDGEHAEHVADVKARLDAARVAGFDTRVQHTIDPDHEFWSAGREECHDVLLAELYERAASVPGEHKAVVAGGLPGAGKTTVLREHVGIELSDYLMINPDEIKTEMVRHGLVPDVEGLTPMEATELVHEECSHLAKRLARLAQADGRNVIWDVTMSKPESAEQRIEALRAGGYTRIDGIFVDTAVEVAASRADARHREGHEAYRAGDGLGGRFMSREMIEAQADSQWGSVNRSNFERVKHAFDAWSVYDNSADGAPVLVSSSGERRTPDGEREDL
jgi:predicted kinase